MAVIRRMVEDLCIPIKIVAGDIVREADGLAMSSRNGYLTPEQRQQAPYLHQTLQEAAQQIIAQGSVIAEGFESIQQIMIGHLAEHGFRPEYFEVRRATDLQIPQQGDTALVILASAWRGKARLIDNVQVFLTDGRIV